jgi:AraC-like DNA-binding protein
LSKPLPEVESFHSSSINADERATFLVTGPSQDSIVQLEQAIESTLGHPEIGLQMTAAILGMSPRTLQRHLAEEEKTFSRLLQSVRFRAAQQLLRDPAMPLNEIAMRLSYADSANFIRAFKRWTGVGPSEFRQLHYAKRDE